VYEERRNERSGELYTFLKHARSAPSAIEMMKGRFEMSLESLRAIFCATVRKEPGGFKVIEFFERHCGSMKLESNG
jgi:hypothetical protein